MKKLLILFLLTGVFSVSQAQVDLENSSVKWTGTQISGKSHYGSLSFKSADVSFNGNELVGGSFVVDMNSLSVDDLSGKGKKSLEGHLMSNDFFSVEMFNTSELKIEKATKTGNNKYNATANLTIKGATHSAQVSFVLNDESNTMTAKLVFDRSKYDVRYGSGSFFENLGDKLILDDIELEVTLVMM